MGSFKCKNVRIYHKKNEITYTEINVINYPNLTLPEQPNVSIGKYGQMRLDYLKKHHRGTYITLLTTCKLSENLAEIDSKAKSHVRDPTKTFANTELPNGSRLKTIFCRRWR